MRTIFLAAAVVFLGSCSGGSSAKYLAGADSLVIHFNDPATNIIVNTINTTESNAIKKIKQFVTGKKTAAIKCGYDGNMIFYSAGRELADISFNFSVDSCRHFIQLIDGQLSSTTMSNEAADFLKSLAEGKNTY